MKRKDFNWRAFTIFLLAFTAVVCATSGIVLYVKPKGRVANWNAWSLLGLSKEQWETVHTLFVLTLLIIVAFHLFYFNWKVFKAYLLKKSGRGLRFKRELAAAGVLILIVLAGTLGKVIPFSSVMALSRNIKAYWERTGVEPPLSRAENLTLAQFTDQILRQDLADVIAVLQAEGIVAGPDELIKTIAARARLAPCDIHERLTAVLPGPAAPASAPSRGKGYGSMSFARVCQALQIDLEQAIRSLELEGIAVNDPDEKLKALAGRCGRSPGDLVRLIQTRVENQNPPQ